MTEPSADLEHAGNRLIRAAHLAHRRVADEWVVLDLRAQRVYGLNSAGGGVLAALARPATFEDLARACGATSAEARRDLAAFVGDLAASGLVLATEDAALAREAPAGGDLAWIAPRVLWAEDAPRSTNQVSPPQAITNPQCNP